MALIAGLSAADAQTAPGGGSFPGSFLIPGTNTSLLVGGAVHLTLSDDFSGKTPQVFEGDLLPIGPHKNGGVEFHAKQSNFFFETRTPTSYGELSTFILFDAFPQITSVDKAAGGTNDTTRLVLAYGTLGPFLAGQTLSLFFDGDALPETVDPTVAVGTNNGNGDRAPQVRYTYVAPGGISLAVSLENPETSGADASGLFFTNTSLAGGQNSNGGSAIVPDVIVRGRIDQGWGHLSAAGIYRNQNVIAAGFPTLTANSYGGQVSGHLNTFGKDTLRGEVLGGRGLGGYLSDDLIFNRAVDTNFAAGRINTVISWGGNLGYTHFWTGSVRSTVDAGYSQFGVDNGILGTAFGGIQEKRHYEGLANLIWSPVPQVDVGIEYIYARRFLQNGASGTENRLEGETIFKF